MARGFHCLAPSTTRLETEKSRATMHVAGSLRSLGRPLTCRFLNKAAASSPTQGNAAPATSSPKPFSAIPGPKPLPLLGNLRDFIPQEGRFFVYFHECFEKYGEIFKYSIMG